LFSSHAQIDSTVGESCALGMLPNHRGGNYKVQGKTFPAVFPASAESVVGGGGRSFLQAYIADALFCSLACNCFAGEGEIEKIHLIMNSW
jgi:hypothetical protein